ncbi:hypothetical protein Ahy_B03g066194 isoform B [Arachis hypogaea]|uniref:Uncharacterized protein n=1 Tax=Arachis hypogaea TaxID=3818 RepID=A0A445A3G4_ARAHY|nr:hypothetical protein Ahy_B03g066194 isoform B [Arachis hypogaea]
MVFDLCGKISRESEGHNVELVVDNLFSLYPDLLSPDGVSPKESSSAASPVGSTATRRTSLPLPKPPRSLEIF